MTLKEYCKATENSTNKLIYAFTDKQIDSENIKAKSVYDFLQMQRTEVIKVESNDACDIVYLDCPLNKFCEEV